MNLSIISHRRVSPPRACRSRGNMPNHESSVPAGIGSMDGWHGWCCHQELEGTGNPGPWGGRVGLSFLDWKGGPKKEIKKSLRKDRG